MKALAAVPILNVTILFLLISSLLLKLLKKLWWTPMKIQKQLNRQGIKGPSYRFINGNAREIVRMNDEAQGKPLSNLADHDMFGRVEPHIKTWVNTYGRNFVFWMGTQALLAVTEPELISEILNNKEKLYRNAISLIYMEKIIGNGLAISEGEKWVKMRRLANFAFHAENLRNMIPAMIASAEMMIEKWEQNYIGREVEVVEEFGAFTAEVISRTAFGSSYIEGKHAFDKVTELNRIINKHALHLQLPIISKIRNRRMDIETDRLAQGIADAIIEITTKRREKMRAGEIEGYGNDFLGLLLKACDDEDPTKRISLQDVIDECKTFFVAGQISTNILLYWTAMLLAINPDWQDKAREEIFSVMGDKLPDSDSLANLKIVGMIINETLRLYPPVTAYTKKADKDVKLGNIHVPFGVKFHISILSAHHNPEIWGKDAHCFNPERFSQGIMKATKNRPGSYLPFGMGPRSCVGYNFSITEAKLALSTILRRFSLTLSPSYVHCPVEYMPIRPQFGIQIILNPLQENRNL